MSSTNSLNGFAKVFLYDEDTSLFEALRDSFKRSRPKSPLELLPMELSAAVQKIASLESAKTDFALIIDLRIDAEIGLEDFLGNHPLECWTYIDESLAHLGGYVLLRFILEKHPHMRNRILVFTGEGAMPITDRLQSLNVRYQLKGFGALKTLEEKISRMEKVICEQ